MMQQNQTPSSFSSYNWQNTIPYQTENPYQFQMSSYLSFEQLIENTPKEIFDMIGAQRVGQVGRISRFRKYNYQSEDQSDSSSDRDSIDLRVMEQILNFNPNGVNSIPIQNNYHKKSVQQTQPYKMKRVQHPFSTCNSPYLSPENNQEIKAQRAPFENRSRDLNQQNPKKLQYLSPEIETEFKSFINLEDQRKLLDIRQVKSKANLSIKLPSQTSLSSINSKKNQNNQKSTTAHTEKQYLKWSTSYHNSQRSGTYKDNKILVQDKQQ